jgi:hypothetical protein
MSNDVRWRTALIIRELELEVDSLARGRPHREQLKELMSKKEMVCDGSLPSALLQDAAVRWPAEAKLYDKRHEMRHESSAACAE